MFVKFQMFVLHKAGFECWYLLQGKESLGSEKVLFLQSCKVVKTPLATPI